MQVIISITYSLYRGYQFIHQSNEKQYLFFTISNSVFEIVTEEMHSDDVLRMIDCISNILFIVKIIKAE